MNKTNVNEENERSLGRILYDKKKQILFLSISALSIYTISSAAYRRGYKSGCTDGYNRVVERIMDKIKV